jgi:hypothetical protein
MPARGLPRRWHDGAGDGMVLSSHWPQRQGEEQQMLKFGSARNDIVNTREAMRDCVKRAQEMAGDDGCNLLVFHTTMGHNFSELLDEAAKLCPDAEVVGCTGSGVVGVEGASERVRALAVMSVGGDTSEFAVAHRDKIQGANSYEVSREVAEALKQKNADIKMINLVASGIDIAADQAIAGIESVFGPDVPIFGGTSGDNMKAKTSFQFHGSAILERGILLIGYADPTLELVSSVHHGSQPIGKPFVVTKSEANRVYELDGQPAWPHLMDRLGLKPDVAIEQTFVLSSLGHELPEELHSSYDNKHSIHTIFKVDDERRTFYAPAAVPEGTKLWLMQRDEQLIFDGTDRMVARLKDKLGDDKPVAVFHTDCAARGKVMFNQILKDEIILRMQGPICDGSEVPWLGLYGFGEFTPVDGHNRFHTQTSSLYALVRRNN